MEYDGREVANFVLDYSDRKQRRVSNLKLQKLVYFCHAWSLIRLSKPLIRHKFEAWEYGPVLPFLYRQFSVFEGDAITGRAVRLDPLTGAHVVVRYDFEAPTQAVIEETVDFYGRLRAGDLVALSHAKGGPWHRIWHHEGRVNPGMQIRDDDILQYYSTVQFPFSVQ